MYCTHCILVSIILGLQCLIAIPLRRQIWGYRLFYVAQESETTPVSQSESSRPVREIVIATGKPLELRMVEPWAADDQSKPMKISHNSDDLLLWKLLSQVVTNLGTRDAVLISSLRNQQAVLTCLQAAAALPKSHQHCMQGIRVAGLFQLLCWKTFTLSQLQIGWDGDGMSFFAGNFKKRHWVLLGNW